MNAPAFIEPPAYAAYIPAVVKMCPDAPQHETRERARLMLLRDLAAQAGRAASWEAKQAFLTVEQISNAHALTPMSVTMLAATRTALGRIYRSAVFLEEVFGADGRG